MPEEKKHRDYTAEEILELVDNKTNSQSYTDWIEQMEDDFDLFSLKEYDAESGHQSYTSPKPRNDFDKISDGIDKAVLTWQIETEEDAPENEREAASKAERLIAGVLTIADEQLKNIGEPRLRHGLRWFGCQRGAVGLKCLLYKGDEEGKAEIDITYLDPMQIRFEKGIKGYSWVAYIYKIGKVEAKERYDVDITSDGAEIIDFFDKTINAVVMKSGTTEKTEKQFVKDPEAHGLDHVPVWFGYAGGMPTMYTKDGDTTLKHQAKSVFSSSRQTYEAYNKQISFMLDAQERSVAGSLIHEMEEGMKPIEGDPYKAYRIMNIISGKEKLYPLEPPKVPPETGAILSAFDRDLQQSTPPWPQAYGVDTGDHSGAALVTLNDAIRSVYNPYCALLEDAYRWLCREILTQIKTKNLSLEVRGYDNKGKFFKLNINPSEIKDDWFFKVTCEPELPRDKAADIQTALVVTEARPPYGRPLLPRHTAMEDIIKVKNPDEQEALIDREMASEQLKQSPYWQVRQLGLEILKKGDLYGALEVLSAAPSPLQGMQGQGQGGAPVPTNGQVPNRDLLEQIALQLQQSGRPIPPELVQMMQQGVPMEPGLTGGI